MFSWKRMEFSKNWGQHEQWSFRKRYCLIIFFLGAYLWNTMDRNITVFARLSNMIRNFYVTLNRQYNLINEQFISWISPALNKLQILTSKTIEKNVIKFKRKQDFTHCRWNSNIYLFRIIHNVLLISCS